MKKIVFSDIDRTLAIEGVISRKNIDLIERYIKLGGTFILTSGRSVSYTKLIAKQIKDASLPILKDVIDIENSSVFNTMIVSSPGAGKTTILRDLIRKISNRNARNRFPTKSMRNSR